MGRGYEMGSSLREMYCTAFASWLLGALSVISAASVASGVVCDAAALVFGFEVGKVAKSLNAKVSSSTVSAL